MRHKTHAVVNKSSAQRGAVWIAAGGTSVAAHKLNIRPASDNQTHARYVALGASSAVVWEETPLGRAATAHWSSPRWPDMIVMRPWWWWFDGSGRLPGASDIGKVFASLTRSRARRFPGCYRPPTASLMLDIDLADRSVRICDPPEESRTADWPGWQADNETLGSGKHAGSAQVGVMNTDR